MGDSTLLPIDTDTIRITCNGVLDGVDLPTGEALDLLKGQLHGHVQLLARDLEILAACMRGWMRWTAVQVLVCAAHLLRESTDTAATTRVVDEHDLAVMARALLTLYLHHGPLKGPTGENKIAEEIRRYRCRSHLRLIAEDGQLRLPLFAATPAARPTVRPPDHPSDECCSPCPYLPRACHH